MTSNNPSILVVGATGKTGSRVARLLADQGHNVRPVSRGSAIPFDWDKPEGWQAALNGVSAAYVTYFPDLAFPGAAEKIEAFTRLAAKVGLRKLVLLSGRGESHAEVCEGIVRDSGLDYTLVRCSWFAQNFSEGYLRDPVLQGVIALPAGQVREPIVDVDDIADVVVATLTDDRHNGQLYEVTGPRLLGFEQAAEALTKATGRTISYVPITLEQFHAGMVEIGGPMIADVFTGICRETLDGRNESLGDGVQRALGRAPRAFAAFCQSAAANGAWSITA
ncbi:MAG: NmrA family transcriptional regulator [Rhodobacteraceae bacterium]|nr:MAG: NmrA family transcriptional regulator [Paracoccaceae bacterium]